MKTIACLGDSNTFGFDPQSLWGGRYPQEVRWTGRLAAAGFRVHNFGVNGLSVSRDAAHPVLVEELLSVKPPAPVTVMLGSNDLLLGLSAAETARHMEKLLSLILSEKAASGILLIAPPAFRPGTWVPDGAMIRGSGLLAAEYRRLAAGKGIRFADAGEWNVPLAYDGVHFTEEGHRIFAERVAELLGGE